MPFKHQPLLEKTSILRGKCPTKCNILWKCLRKRHYHPDTRSTQPRPYFTKKRAHFEDWHSGSITITREHQDWCRIYEKRAIRETPPIIGGKTPEHANMCRISPRTHKAPAPIASACGPISIQHLNIGQLQRLVSTTTRNLEDVYRFETHPVPFWYPKGLVPNYCLPDSTPPLVQQHTRPHPKPRDIP